MSKLGWIIGSVAVVGTGIGAYIFYKRQVAELENIGVDFTGIQMESFTMDQAKFLLKLRFSSNARIEAKVKNFDLAVYLATYQVATINNPPATSVIIPVKTATSPGISETTVEVNFSPKQVFNDFPALAKTYAAVGNLPMVIKGKAKVQSAFVTLPIPVEYDTTFNDMVGKIQIPDLVKKAIGLL